MTKILFGKYLNQEFTNYFVQTRKFTILDREYHKEIARINEP